MSKEASQTNALERIATLERRLKKEDESIIKKLMQYAGLVALIFTILLGGWEIYDSTILSNKREIRNIVTRISEINLKSVELGSQLGWDPIKMESITTNTSIEKEALLERAFTISKFLKERIGFAAALSLSWENLQFARFDRAVYYSDMAIKLADSEGFLKVQALRHKGLAIFHSDSKQGSSKGREIFRESINLAKQSPNFQHRTLIVTLYRDWIATELIFGNCKIVEQKYGEAQKEIEDLFESRSGYLVQYQEWLRKNVGLMLLTQNKCSIDV